jgi:phage terminase small subunit
MPVLENAKHEHFAQAVAGGSTLTDAAISAGYSPASARQQGSTLCTKHDIAERIAELQATIIQVAVSESGLDKAWVMKKLEANVNRAMQAELVIDAQGANAGMYTYQGNVANKALELIGRELGMFKQAVVHSGLNGGPIEIAAIRRVIVDPARMK